MRMLIGTTRYQARKAYPGAAVIAKCEGGYIAFDCYTDYQLWRCQK